MPVEPAVTVPCHMCLLTGLQEHPLFFVVWNVVAQPLFSMGQSVFFRGLVELWPLPGLVIINLLVCLCSFWVYYVDLYWKCHFKAWTQKGAFCIVNSGSSVQIVHLWGRTEIILKELSLRKGAKLRGNILMQSFSEDCTWGVLSFRGPLKKKSWLGVLGHISRYDSYCLTRIYLFWWMLGFLALGLLAKHG